MNHGIIYIFQHMKFRDSYIYLSKFKQVDIDLLQIVCFAINALERFLSFGNSI